MAYQIEGQADRNLVPSSVVELTSVVRRFLCPFT